MSEFVQLYCSTCGEPLDENGAHLNPEHDESHPVGRAVDYAAEVRRRVRMGEDAVPPREHQKEQPA